MHAQMEITPSYRALGTRTYGTLRLMRGGKKWCLEGVEPHVSIRVKDVFRRVSKSATGEFKFPNDSTHCADLSWFLSRYPMEMSNEDSLILEKGRSDFERLQRAMEQILLPDFVPPPTSGLREGCHGRGYQSQAVEIWMRRLSLLLGDEVGLGKTYTSILGLAGYRETLPAAVVCQTHLPKQWREAIESFSHLRVHVIKGGKPYDLPEADVYIFKYSILSGWIDIFKTGFFQSVVYDEIQELRTGTKSDKGAAAKVLSDNAVRRIGLTATPVYNYASDMWNVMEFVHPGALGTWDEFCREWCDRSGKYVKDPQALGSYLREQFLFLRRTKGDVGQEMDNVIPIVESVSYDENAVKSVEELAKTLAIKATRGAFVERGQAARDLDMLVRQTTGIAKAKAVAQFCKILLANDRKVLLVGWHRDVYAIWQKELADFTPVMFTGSETASQKEKSKQAFINGDAKVMIMSLRSGAGLDGLQHVCSTVVFGELDWSPMVHHQVIGRLDREGQKEKVMAFFLHTDDGSDPPMMALLGLKKSHATALVDPNLGVQEMPEDGVDRMKALIRHYLDKEGIDMPSDLEIEASEDSYYAQPTLEEAA